MKKGKSLQIEAGFIGAALVGFIFIMVTTVQGVGQPGGGNEEHRADIITLDSIKVFGKLERSPVVFFHERHTDALEKKNKDCATCHLSENDHLSPKFKRVHDTNKKAVMEIYHTNCIACHQETKAAKEVSGPVECGECHKEKISVISSRQPMGMDKSLHYRHAKMLDNKCEKCHHEYNKETQKLFYAKGKEGTCRYCHGKTTEDNRISMQLASHLSCIDCHRKTLAKNESAGPVHCNGCHDFQEQEMIEVVENIPRLQRSQPDIVFVKSSRSENQTADLQPEGRMNPVPFNHLAHEEYNDSCRVCHHADLKTCVSCHTRMGSNEGKQITLEQAMHQLNSTQSCLGCHKEKQQNRLCAGCHASIDPGSGPDQSSCLTCHMKPLAESTAESLKRVDKMQPARLLESRKEITDTYSDKEIPEKVMIKVIADQYKTVELPHRKIVHTLVENIKDNKLVNYYHLDEGTICRACHHNSPLSTKPPRCASCHGKPFDNNNLFRPGLMAAYHRQCMQCHSDMGLKKPVATNCIACHKEKT